MPTLLSRLTGKTLLAATGAAGAVAAYAFFMEPRWLEVTHTRIPIERLPPILSGFRIALISDLHAGGGTPLWLIRRAGRLAMQAQPDLIALTGDFTSADSRVSEHRVFDALPSLHAPLGVFAVPGNHDHDHGFEEWKEAVGAHGNVTDLTNRVYTTRYNGAEVCVAGVDDLDTGSISVDVLQQAGQADLSILLAHNPDTAEALGELDARVDLVLSGHTHGGQVRAPVVGPMLNPAHFDGIYVAGLVERPWTKVYISRGVGTVHLPVRFMCRPEVAILELVSP